MLATTAWHRDYLHSWGHVWSAVEDTYLCVCCLGENKGVRCFLQLSLQFILEFIIAVTRDVPSVLFSFFPNKVTRMVDENGNPSTVAPNLHICGHFSKL